MEVQDYMKDLHEWEDKVTTKDKRLIQDAEKAKGAHENENCPPVRGIASFNTQETPESLAGPSSKLFTRTAEKVGGLLNVKNEK